jgi:hypothetical protein
MSDFKLVNSVYTGTSENAPSSLSSTGIYFSYDTGEILVFNEYGGLVSQNESSVGNEPSFNKLTLTSTKGLAQMTGTVTVSQGFTQVTGLGTDFGNEINNADIIQINGETHVVSFFFGNTLYVQSAFASSASGVNIYKESTEDSFTINVDGSDVFNVDQNGDAILSGDLDLSNDGRMTTGNSTYAHNYAQIDGSIYATNFQGNLSNGVTAATQLAGNNSTRVATTAYVDSSIPSVDGFVSGSGNEEYIPMFSSDGSEIVNSRLNFVTDNILRLQAGVSNQDAIFRITSNNSNSYYTGFSTKISSTDYGRGGYVLGGSLGSGGNLFLPYRAENGLFYNTGTGTGRTTQYKMYGEYDSYEQAAQFSAIKTKDVISDRISGYVTTDGSTSTVNGVSTSFTTEFQVGDYFRFDSYWNQTGSSGNTLFTVASIVSDTELTLNSTPNSYSNSWAYKEQSTLSSVKSYDNTEKFAVTQDGLKLPKFTTTEINAISNPTSGLTLYNTTLNTLCFYNGSSWQKVSHANM